MSKPRKNRIFCVVCDDDITETNNHHCDEAKLARIESGKSSHENRSYYEPCPAVRMSIGFEMMEMSGDRE